MSPDGQLLVHTNKKVVYFNIIFGIDWWYIKHLGSVCRHTDWILLPLVRSMIQFHWVIVKRYLWWLYNHGQLKKSDVSSAKRLDFEVNQSAKLLKE